MSDVFTTEKRSEVMKAVKSRNTKTTELKMMQIFKELHIIGWRRTYPLIGKPDFVFPKKRIVVFVDGCFWHGHDCRNVTPSANADFWNAKRAYNKPMKMLKQMMELGGIASCKELSEKYGETPNFYVGCVMNLGRRVKKYFMNF